MTRLRVQKKRFKAAQESEAAKRRFHFVWVEPDDSEEQMEAKKQKVIADGHADPNDRFCYIGWKGRTDTE